MTIDKAIKMLEEIIDEGWLISDLEKCPAIDACELAIDIMHKYQRIEQIVEQYQFYKFDGFLKIKEILEQE